MVCSIEEGCSTSGFLLCGLCLPNSEWTGGHISAMVYTLKELFKSLITPTRTARERGKVVSALDVALRLISIVIIVRFAWSLVYWGCTNPDRLSELKPRNIEPAQRPEDAALLGSTRSDARVVQMKEIQSAKIALLKAESPHALFAVIVMPKGNGWVPSNSVFFPTFEQRESISIGGGSFILNGKKIRILMGEIRDSSVKQVEIKAENDVPLDDVPATEGTWLVVVEHTRRPLIVSAVDGTGRVLSAYQNQFQRTPLFGKPKAE